MTSPFDTFRSAAERLAPRTMIVLGSGLADVAEHFTRDAVLSFSDVPGFVPTTVHGHKGQLAVGQWAGASVLVSFGRVHFYEGHPWDRVTRLIRLAAESGVRRVILTNAAGGIHPSLTPGVLMAIRGHIKLLDREAWRRVANEEQSHSQVYTPSLATCVQDIEARSGREFRAGVYAALTGPSYETPAEIRALRAMGADAVGMSTAVEAETAARLGLEVAGISTITNLAAGLSAGPLHHAEVERTARLAAARLGRLIEQVLHAV